MTTEAEQLNGLLKQISPLLDQVSGTDPDLDHVLLSEVFDKLAIVKTLTYVQDEVTLLELRMLQRTRALLGTPTLRPVVRFAGFNPTLVELRNLAEQLGEARVRKALPYENELTMRKWLDKHWKLAKREANAIDRGVGNLEFNPEDLFTLDGQQLADKLEAIYQIGTKSIELILQAKATWKTQTHT